MTIDAYDDLTLAEWHHLTIDAVTWAETELTEHIRRPVSDQEHYEDEWAPLYYMMCAYSNEYRVGLPTIHCQTLDELQSLAKETTDWLKQLASEIRAVTDDDLDNMLNAKQQTR